jgi:hypothetical protein
MLASTGAQQQNIHAPQHLGEGEGLGFDGDFKGLDPRSR